MRQIAKQYKNAKKIGLIADNYPTHKKKSLLDRYGEELGKKIWNRFEVHYTPKHASWLNQAEIGIFKCTKECIGRRRFGEIEVLKKRSKSLAKGGKSQRRQDKLVFHF